MFLQLAHLQVFQILFMDPSLTDQRLAFWLKDGNQINFSNRQAFPIFLLPTMPAVGGNQLIDQNSQLAPWTGIGNWYLCSRFFTHFVNCILNWFRNHFNSTSSKIKGWADRKDCRNSVWITIKSFKRETLSQRFGQNECTVSVPSLSHSLKHLTTFFWY